MPALPREIHAIKFHSRRSTGISVRSLTGPLTLTVNDVTFQRLDPNSSSRVVTLPPEGRSSNGIAFRIVNTGDSGLETLTVKDDGGSTVATLGQNEATWLACDGTTWYHAGIETIAQS